MGKGGVDDPVNVGGATGLLFVVVGCHEGRQTSSHHSCCGRTMVAAPSPGCSSEIAPRL